MKHLRRLHFTAILAALAGCLVLLASCTEPPPRPGTAQDQAATATARADANTQAATAAAVDAAAKGAQANALEQAAAKDPTPARIQAAVDARVAAETATAVAIALDQQAKVAAETAQKAARIARDERAADAAAADLRQWIRLCRWIGLAGLIAGVALGAVLTYFGGPRLGIPTGAAVATLGTLVVAFGQTITWLPLALGAAVVIGLGLWLVTHQRTLRLGMELSRTVDVIQGDAVGTIDDAKKELGKALDRSGLRSRFARLRQSWKRKPA